MAIKHTKVVNTGTYPDDGTSPVGTNEWNDDHTIDNNTITDAMVSSHTTTKITVPTTQLDGTVTNSQLAGSIDNTKLATDPLARANHTGSQAASTINDFDTEVSNNTSVTANTAKNSYPSGDSTKLAGIETSADVTDSTNVDAAGALMLSDTTTTGLGIVVDEDTMSSDSNTKVPTQQSVKAYVDTEVTSALTAEMSFKGDYNATTNSPDLDTSPSGVAKGDMYVVSVAGTFFTVVCEVGDVLVAKSASASLETDWVVVQANVVAASATVAGNVELATVAETDTGSDSTRALTPAGLAGSALQTKVNGIATSANNYVHPNHSGDVTSTADGATAIASGVIVDGDINATATIDATKIADGTVTSTEFQYINSLSSNAQTQIDTKSPSASPTFTGTVTTAAVDVAGNNIDNIQNLIHDTSTTTTTLDFNGDQLQTISISADTTFTTSNKAIGRSKTIKITTDATLRTLTFPAWTFVGTKPADQAASKVGILTITCFGAADTDIVAAYAVEE